MIIDNKYQKRQALKYFWIKKLICSQDATLGKCVNWILVAKNARVKKSYWGLLSCQLFVFICKFEHLLHFHLYDKVKCFNHNEDLVELTTSTFHVLAPAGQYLP